MLTKDACDIVLYVLCLRQQPEGEWAARLRNARLSLI